jgi:hypothetical protein
MKIENGFNALYCLLITVLNRTSMFAALHSDINYLKPGLRYFISECSAANIDVLLRTVISKG